MPKLLSIAVSAAALAAFAPATHAADVNTAAVQELAPTG